MNVNRSAAMRGVAERTPVHAGRHGRRGGWPRRNWGLVPARGTVLVGVLIALLVLTLITLGLFGMVRLNALGATISHDGNRAQMAADAAANMAVKELMDGSDLDGDGTIGSISNDGNAANDPTLFPGTRMWASRSDASGVMTILARGQSAQARRATQVLATGSSGSGGGGSQVFFTRESSAAVRHSSFNTGTQTWGAAATSGTLSNAPIWCAAAASGTSTMVLVSDSGDRLRYGLADSSGTATFSQMVDDLGSGNSRPFDVATEPSSGEGLMIYFHKPPQKMQSRTVINGTLGDQVDMPLSTSDVHWARLVPMSASGNELMALTIDGNEDLHAVRWTGSAWTGQTTLHTSIHKKDAEGMAGAIEATSGRLMVAYSDATDNRVGYRIFTPGSGWPSSVTPGSGWSSNVWINGFDAKVHWIRLISLPSSNSILLAASNDVGRLRTSRWNGTTWTTPTSITDNVGGTNSRHFDLHVSPDGSDVILMYGKGGAAVFYRLWTGSGWSSEATAFTLSSGTAQTVLVRPGSSASTLVGVVGDSNGGANAWSWNGNAFGAVSRVGTTGTSFKEFEWFAIPPGTSGSASKPTITEWAVVAP